MKKDKTKMGGYIVEGEGSNEKVYHIETRLIKDRVIMFYSDFNEESCKDLVAKLLFLDSQSNDEITIQLNSGGGNVHDGLAVIDTMYYIKSPVRVVVAGVACSMAFALTACADKRECLENSFLMAHSVSSGIGRSTIHDMKISMKHTQRLQDRLMTMIAEKCGKTKEEIEALTERDLWLDSREAMAFGVIDRIIPNNKAKKQPTKDDKKKK